MTGDKPKYVANQKNQQWIRQLRPIVITKKRYAAWASIWGIAYLGFGTVVILAPDMPWPLGLAIAITGVIHFGAAIAAARSSPAFDHVFPGLNYTDPLRIIVWFVEHALGRASDPADPTGDMDLGSLIPGSSHIKEIRYMADRVIIIREPERINKFQHNLAVAIALGAGVLLCATGGLMFTLLTGDWILLGGVIVILGVTFGGIGVWGLIAGLRGQGFQRDESAGDPNQDRPPSGLLQPESVETE